MTHPPAIAVLEFDSVAVGTYAADAMLKKATLTAFQAGTVQPGRYIILIGGGVAEVEESHAEALRTGAEALTDEILLPDVHSQVYAAIAGKRLTGQGEALGILETSAIPSVVAASDKAVKAADITIMEIRLGDGLGGKGVTHLNGRLHEVEAAMEAALDSIDRPTVTVRHRIIASADAMLRDRIASATEFHGPREVR